MKVPQINRKCKTKPSHLWFHFLCDLAVEEERKTEDAPETDVKAGEELEEKKKACPCCSEEPGKDEKTAKACSCRSESSASSEDSAVSSEKVWLASSLCCSGHQVIHRSVALTLCVFETKHPEVKVEEEELSELQLRLLALQSASKKWQQKEQQVMKRSKDRIHEKSSSSAAAPFSRQRVTSRSVSATAADRTRARSKPPDKDRTKAAARPPDRERPKPSPKPGPKTPLERGRATGKPHMAKKTISPGETEKTASPGQK